MGMVSSVFGVVSCFTWSLCSAWTSRRTVTSCQSLRYRLYSRIGVTAEHPAISRAKIKYPNRIAFMVRLL